MPRNRSQSPNETEINNDGASESINDQTIRSSDQIKPLISSEPIKFKSSKHDTHKGPASHSLEGKSIESASSYDTMETASSSNYDVNSDGSEFGNGFNSRDLQKKLPQVQNDIAKMLHIDVRLNFNSYFKNSKKLKSYIFY